MKSSLRITALVTIAALSALVYVAGSASAAGNKPAGPPAANAGAGGGGGARPAPPRGPQFMAPAAKYLEMKPAALQKQLKAKKTLASLAEAKGKSVDGLKDAIIADAQSHLSKDVTAGRIDQDEADDRLADLQSRIDDIVSRPMPARGNCPNHPGGGAAGGAGAANGGAAAGGTTAGGDYGNGATTGGTTTTTTGGGYL